MGFYRDRILPLLINLAMRNRRLVPYRERTISGAEGRVLEIGRRERVGPRRHASGPADDRPRDGPPLHRRPALSERSESNGPALSERSESNGPRGRDRQDDKDC